MEIKVWLPLTAVPKGNCSGKWIVVVAVVVAAVAVVFEVVEAVKG